ncbi:MAG TPA: acyl-CoA dehydrogenase, partial [Frankiaceae bacterium]|nr:acyl-CoA dehydrogenase [Frankiaceae bacterium]
VAREAVDQHVQVAGGLVDPDVTPGEKARLAVKAGGFYAGWLPKLAVGEGLDPRAYEEFGPLAKHLRFVERGARKLARATFYGMTRWQAGLESRQAFLGRIVDLGAELFAMTAAVVYARTTAAADPAHGRQTVELAELFCGQARRRANRLFHDLWSNDDAGNHAAAQRVLAGRYAFFEHDVLDPARQDP